VGYKNDTGYMRVCRNYQKRVYYSDEYFGINIQNKVRLKNNIGQFLNKKILTVIKNGIKSILLIQPSDNSCIT
jgi:hypothetical protein